MKMGRLRRALHQIRWSMAVRGGGGTAGLIIARLLRRSTAVPEGMHAFDLAHGVETSGRISGAELGAGHPHDVHTTAYLAVPPSRFRAAITQWQTLPGTRPVATYAFVDVGCGKGRAVLLAAGMGFRECLGVELDPGLAAIAQRNVNGWRVGDVAAPPMRIVNADAIESELPQGPMLIYLYNPFRGVVLRRLLARLEALASSHAGELDVLYLVPEQAAEFATYPQFACLWKGAVAASDEDVAAQGSDRYDACAIFRR